MIMKFIISKRNSASKQEGFTLLFALLVSAILLSVGLSIADITLQQFELSASGRNSQYAFYAADSGAECALYWDRHGAVTGTSAFATSSLSTPVSPITCNASTMYPTIDSNHDTQATIRETTIFYIDYPAINSNDTETCSMVKVIKNADGTTIIDSTGYNSKLVNGACDLTNPSTVERGIEINF